MEIKELEIPTDRGGSFVLGILGSVAGALLGAIAWCVIAVATDYELGIIAWALGGLAGFGMALGCRRRHVAAGVTAATVAVLGILSARVMIVGYLGREELSAIRQRLAVLDLPVDRFEHVFHLTARDASREAKQEGRCPFDELYWQRMFEAGAKYAALSDDELADAIAEYREWNRAGRFEDAEYVRRTLPYLLLEDGHLEIWYLLEPLPKEEWEPVYEEARARAARLAPDERSRECRRRAYAGATAYMNATRRSLERGLASGDKDSGLRLLEEAYAEALAMEDAALADAFAEAHALEWEEGDWNSKEWQRPRLTHLYAERAWREREGAAPDTEPQPGPAWDECYREAAETVAAMADDKLPDRLRAAERERDAEIFAARQQTKSEQQRGLAAGIAVYAVSTFDALDLVFLALAVVTAYRVALSRAQAPSE